MQKGNDFGDEFDEFHFVMKQVMVVKLKVEEPSITFDPPFEECRDILLRCFSEIIASGEGLPRVSSERTGTRMHARVRAQAHAHARRQTDTHTHTHTHTYKCSKSWTVCRTHRQTHTHTSAIMRNKHARIRAFLCSVGVHC